MKWSSSSSRSSGACQAMENLEHEIRGSKWLTKSDQTEPNNGAWSWGDFSRSFDNY